LKPFSPSLEEGHPSEEKFSPVQNANGAKGMKLLNRDSQRLFIRLGRKP